MRGRSEMTKVPEIGTVGNLKWLKCLNSEVGNQPKFSKIGRKERRKSEFRFTSGTQNLRHPPFDFDF